MIRGPISFGLFAVALVACGEASGDEPALAAWERFQAVHRCERLVFQATAPALRVKANLLAQAARIQTGHEVEVVDAIRPERTALRVVLGTVQEREIVDLAGAFGLEVLPDGGFRLLGRAFRSSADLVVATFDEPGRPGRPLVLALGNDANKVARRLEALPLPWRPGLRAWSDGQPELDVPLSSSGRPLEERLIDHARRRADYWRDSQVRVDDGLSVRVHPTAVGMSPLRAYVRDCVGARRRVQKWLGGSRLPEAEVFVYDHAEDFEALLGPGSASRVDLAEGRIHALVSAGVPTDAGAGVARATAAALTGPTAAEWMLDGIAVAAAQKWWSRDLEEWVAYLAAAGQVPRPIELVAPDAPGKWSAHVVQPLRGFLFLKLLERVGPKRARELFLAPPARLPRAIFTDFNAAIEQLAGTAPVDPERRRARSYAQPFRNGIALYDAGEPDGALSTYARRSVEPSLERARALGADAFSLTVFASEEPREPAWVQLEIRAVHGSASDVALASALAAGRRHSLRGMLVVEPLSAPDGTWGDGLVMGDRAMVARFFDSFTRIATHYALLSELCGVEILCLGSNLNTAERSLVWDDHASDKLLRTIALEHWTKLIARVRRCFRGALTHGARTRNDVEQVGFWRQLDYIGLAMYPSFLRAEIPDEDAPVRRIMRREIDRALLYAELWERPLLFTQIGFPSRAEAWRRAYAPHGALDLEQQRRFYDLLGEILARKRRDGDLRGFYLWHWASDPEAGGAADGGFTPQNKPAEAELPRLFGSS